ncbi:hypothetical protein ACOMHN_046331 [Nucella lapillus]
MHPTILLHGWKIGSLQWKKSVGWRSLCHRSENAQRWPLRLSSRRGQPSLTAGQSQPQPRKSATATNTANAGSSRLNILPSPATLANRRTLVTRQFASSRPSLSVAPVTSSLRFLSPGRKPVLCYSASKTNWHSGISNFRHS